MFYVNRFIVVVVMILKLLWFYCASYFKYEYEWVLDDRRITASFTALYLRVLGFDSRQDHFSLKYQIDSRASNEWLSYFPVWSSIPYQVAESIPALLPENNLH